VRVIFLDAILFRMKKFYKYKIYVIFLIITLVLVCLFFSVKINNTHTEQSASSQCNNLLQNNFQSCLSAINKLVQSNPRLGAGRLNEVWMLAESGGVKGDLRLFSPVAHNIGMGLVDKGYRLGEAIKICGYSFKDACVHGAVMEFIDKKYPGNVSSKKFIGLCDSLGDRINNLQYQNCVHGIGHELRAKIHGVNEDLVLLCNYFASNYRNACASGILMEFSKGNTGDGFHVDSEVGSVSFDCSKLPTDYLSSCYSSLGSYVEYEANGDHWENSFKLCLSVSNKYQNDCFAGLDERLLMANGGNQELATELCSTLLPLEKKGCLLVKNIKLNTLQ
jgi:hypothetical protein